MSTYRDDRSLPEKWHRGTRSSVYRSYEWRFRGILIDANASIHARTRLASVAVYRSDMHGCARRGHPIVGAPRPLHVVAGWIDAAVEAAVNGNEHDVRTCKLAELAAWLREALQKA